ncbi:TetR/AcrR family transcriptional regulator [Gordonia sp. (in: high G+C Gram-positive bacteria)]|uniref:TetR/AcrR family transcriptional regulator n=1 Tax=Gordonia sp. (in: high G+C Gram-positive bacteria) TaxID=84139 RepID=UPI003F9B39B0
MGSSRSGSKGVPRAEREQQILDAAALEFGTRGYAAVSMVSIADRAEISKPLIFDYFGSKEGLYRACCRRAGQRITSLIETAMQTWQPGEVDPRGIEVLAAIFSALDGRPHDWNVVFDTSLPDKGAALDEAKVHRRTLIGQAAAGIGSTYADILVDEHDVSALVHVWTSTVSSLVDWWLHHPEYTASEMTERSARILRALQSPLPE